MHACIAMGTHVPFLLPARLSSGGGGGGGGEAGEGREPGSCCMCMHQPLTAIIANKRYVCTYCNSKNQL